MKVLIACEESQRVCTAFRERGHESYSCDIVACSGGHPEWHIMDSCIPLLNGNVGFCTMDGEPHTINGKWDLIIAHPPCTYFTVAGNRWFNVQKYGQKAIERERERDEAVRFFMSFVNADCDRIAIENPIGYMSTHYRKPDQVIQPWMFGDNHSKSTCLWLKGLNPLVPEVTVQPDLEWFEWYDEKAKRMKRQPLWCYKAFCDAKTPKERARMRSKTFPGIARAFADQWGRL